MDLEHALELFANGSTEEASRAYETLCNGCRDYLERFLNGSGVPKSQVEDIIQDAFVKAWKARPQFKNEGLTRWRAYLKRVALNAYIDTRRGQVVQTEFDGTQVPPNERPIIDAFYLSMLTKRLYHCANQIWMGLDATLSSETHERQLIAAQHYYLDGVPVEDILGLMPCPPAGEPPLTRELLRRWLNDDGVLRYLAFTTLYYSNDRLAALMLGYDVDEDVDWDGLYEEIGALSPEAPAVKGLNWVQVAVILWHFRHAMNVTKMVQTLDSLRDEGKLKAEWNVSPEHFSAVLVILVAQLPFKEKARVLLKGLSRNRQVDPYVCLSAHALWERLVFQYRYHDDIPVLDIVERTYPAAREIDAQESVLKINEGIVSTWTSGNRLRNKLVAYWKQAYGGDFDE